MEPDAVEIRVLGCLLEKERATPYVYPLSIDSLRRGCNQSRSRDPVVSYEEPEIEEALRRLAERGWIRKADEDRSRVVKYRHVLGEVFDLDPSELSLLAVLLLRGTQTAGELKERSERLFGFGSVRAVHESLGRLVEHGFVVRHARRSGKKEERYEQQLAAVEPARAAEKDAERVQRDETTEGRLDLSGNGEGGDADAGERNEGREEMSAGRGWEREEEKGMEADEPVAESQSRRTGAVDSRIDWLEAEVVKLRAQLTALMKELGK